ncbi:MAG: ABC transporter permease [Pyrinomonadaceae bacterium]
MSTLWQDVRYSLRVWLKRPGFTVVAVLSLALGIGANTAIFSVVQAVLLRPLPFAEADRLVYLTERNTQLDGVSLSWPNFTDWRAQNHVFEKIAAYNRDSYNLTSGGDPERLLAAQASADLFAVLRVHAAQGRVFTNEEDAPGANPVVVLSYGLWQRRFGGAANVVGQSITLNGRGYTVVGVMPQGFAFPNRVELWLPLGQLAQPAWQNRDNHMGLFGVARLKPGVALEQARADLNNITASLAQQYPDTNADERATLTPLQETYVKDIRLALWTLLGAVGFVLAVACANVANLLLARTAIRQREFAIRAALGASRRRIVRQLLVESLLLALTSGGLGLLLALWGVDLILAIRPDYIPRANEIGIDARVLLFTAAVSMLTGLIFGLVPALQASRPDLQAALREGKRGPVWGRSVFRSGLVITEVALTLVLLVGTGLLLRSFQRLQQVEPGFTYEHLLSVNVTLPARKYPDVAQRINFTQEVLPKLRALPGVADAAVSSGLPLGYNNWQAQFVLDGRPQPPPAQTPVMDVCAVSLDYFRTMGIPLLKGRYFNAQDNRQWLDERSLQGRDEGARAIAGVNAIIIDEEFARRYWPNEDATGQRIRFGADASAPALTVVGVVGRVRMEGLKTDVNRGQGYLPYLQLPTRSLAIVVRSALAPEQIVAAVRRQVLAVDREQPVYNVRTLAQMRATSLAPAALNLTLLGIFAGLALVLAAVGIYGVIAYTVSQRTHEIGIRVALGAQRRDIFKLIVGRGLLLVLAGIGLGLCAALALARLLSSLLFGVSATDPLVFAVVALLLASVALLACYLPARRAMKIDPMVALRYE